MARTGASPLRSLSVLLLPLLLAGLCVHPQYLPQVDSAAQSLNDELTAFVHKMTSVAGTPEGSYASNQQFYTDAQKKIQDLRAVAQGENSEDILKQVGTISENVDNLRKLHELGGDKGLRSTVADPALKILQAQFKALAALQDSLRVHNTGGTSTSTSSGGTSTSTSSGSTSPNSGGTSTSSGGTSTSSGGTSTSTSSGGTSTSTSSGGTSTSTDTSSNK